MRLLLKFDVCDDAAENTLILIEDFTVVYDGYRIQYHRENIEIYCSDKGV